MKSIPLLKYTSDFLIAVCGPQYFSAIAGGNKAEVCA
jgi:hypothetical protein